MFMSPKFHTRKFLYSLTRRLTNHLTMSYPPPDSYISAEKGMEYWESINSDVDGMLGGIPSLMPSISRIDLQGSRTFLARLGVGVKTGRQRIPRVLEGGAGIGRITKGLLLSLADQVDVVEPVVKFSDELRGTPGVGEIHNVGLEKWQPTEGAVYDLIWIQWCIGHLTDQQVLEFLETCKSVLEKDQGVIVIKENLSTWGEDQFDELDSSVTREDEKFQMLFKKAGMRLVKSDLQRGFPAVKDLNLLPMKMFALRPETGSEA